MNTDTSPFRNSNGWSRPSTAPRTAGLSEDFLQENRRRLGILALIYGITYFIAAFLLPSQLILPQPAQRLADLLSVCFIAVGFGLFLYTRYVTGTQERFRILGLGFEVFGALGIELFILFWNGDPSQVPMGLPWTAVWVVVFPFFVPSTPLTTGVAAVIAASIRPLLLGVLVLRGITLPDVDTLLLMVVPTYLCAAIAVVGSRVVFGLRRDISEARHMGSYKLVERLGAGGMGEVWRAHHRMLARPAAIKLVRRDVTRSQSGAESLGRFEREVQATAQLKSQHTIDVYDYGHTSDGTFYYVMELLDGADLEHIVATHGPLSAGRVVHIMKQACHSLVEAHEQKLVHRDIKPANIFLCRYGREVDVVKVLDFGLVTMERGLGGGDNNLTVAGAFYGTPAYAAPEMARGEHLTIDGRADVYSLGCVAYWLLTGRQVFEAASPLEMLLKQNSEMPPQPSKHASMPMPQVVDDIVMACLTKEVEDRPTASQLGEMLRDRCREVEWVAEHAMTWWTTYMPARRWSEGGGVREGAERTVVKAERAS